MPTVVLFADNYHSSRSLEKIIVCKRLHSVHAVDWLTGGEENVSRLLLDLPVSDMEFICSWLLYSVMITFL